MSLDCYPAGTDLRELDPFEPGDDLLAYDGSEGLVPLAPAYRRALVYPRFPVPEPRGLDVGAPDETFCPPERA